MSWGPIVHVWRVSGVRVAVAYVWQHRAEHALRTVPSMVLTVVPCRSLSVSRRCAHSTTYHMVSK